MAPDASPSHQVSQVDRYADHSLRPTQRKRRHADGGADACTHESGKENESENVSAVLKRQPPPGEPVHKVCAHQGLERIPGCDQE